MLLHEEHYAERMKEEVLPYLAARRAEDTFATPDGLQLYRARYTADQPRATVLLIHGFSETAEKYLEMIYYFLRDGLSVVTLDQRGHGRSPRAAAHSVTHVDRFDEYLDDISALLDDMKDTAVKPLYLYAHSMGGAVGALTLIRYPSLFRRAVLSSPMIAPRHDGLPLFVCRAICRFCMLTWRAQKPIFVAKNNREHESFEHSSSLSRVRFDFYREAKEKNPLLQGGKPTYAWTYAALGVTARILKKGAPERVNTPVLIFSASNDHLVQNAPQETLARRLPAGGLIELDCKHEIYAAHDEILHPYVDRVLEFFK